MSDAHHSKNLPLADQLRALQLEVARLSFFLPSSLLGIFPSIVKGGSFIEGRADKIEKQRTDKCKVTVVVDVKYEVENTTTETELATGKVIRTCTTYKITTKITVSETCDPGGTQQLGTSTHVSHKTFCNNEGDEPKTGESVGFDGKETDTLTYPHGTKLTVEKNGEKIKVNVVFPDGTTASMDVPK